MPFFVENFFLLSLNFFIAHNYLLINVLLRFIVGDVNFF